MTSAAWLPTIALAFAGVGVAVAGVGGGPLFSVWRDAAARSLLGRAAFPGQLDAFAGLTFGILGASIVGKWLAAWWLARRLRRSGERWVWDALAVGLIGWFAIDSTLSIVLGAWFNVWMINLAPLLAFGVPLWRARPAGPRQTPARPQSPAWSVLLFVCACFSGVGLVLVLAPTSALFTSYSDAIADAYFGGTRPAIAVAWQRFAYGLIGGTFAAHFAMLACAVRFAAGQRWVLEAVAGSMLGWFVVDASLSLVHGGAFNVWMIDVPALVAVAVPWFSCRRTATDAGSAACGAASR